jgi:hypothetical protein
MFFFLKPRFSSSAWLSCASNNLPLEHQCRGRGQWVGGLAFLQAICGIKDAVLIARAAVPTRVQCIIDDHRNGLS